MVVILGMALSFPGITVGLLIDLLRPYLTWDNPQKAIKQNINVLLGMVAGGGILYLIYLAARFVLDNTKGDFPVYLTVLVTSLFFGIIPYAIMSGIAVKRYRDINN